MPDQIGSGYARQAGSDEPNRNVLQEMKEKRVIRWLPAVICMAVIFAFSAQNGEESGEVSSGFLSMLLSLIPKEWLDPDGSTKVLIHFLVRKAAHFSVYALLGSSYLFALWRYSVSPALKGVLAVAMSFLYACTDEFHQGFVAGRGPSFTDVLIDSLGAATAVGLIFLFLLLRKKAINNKD